jgi:hypothetical protein
MIHFILTSSIGEATKKDQKLFDYNYIVFITWCYYKLENH